MPVRKAQPGDAAGIVSCINEMFGYLRVRSALDASTNNWTLRTLQGWAAAGYEAVVYANTNAGGRIDGVCIFQIENHIHAPDVASRPWMAIKVMAVRAQTVADTVGAHERLLMLPLKIAIPDMVARFPAVAGVVCDYNASWARLHNFLGTWARAEFEVRGETERCWLRISAGLPEFSTRAATVVE